MNAKGKTALKLRAAGALLAFLVGWVSAPLALISAEVDVCAMPCCVREGHCCCSARHTRVARKPQAGRDAFDNPSIIESCPLECTSSFSATLIIRDLVSTPSPSFVVSGFGLNHSRLSLSLRNLLATVPSSPRAPPFQTNWVTT